MNIISRFAISALLLVAGCLDVHAQKVWTLQQCISHAIAHNITVQRQEDNVHQQEITLNTLRNSRLPNLTASAGENFSFGRGLTADNTYANRNTQSTNFGLGTSVPLITGGQIPAQIRQQKLGLKAAMQDFQKAQDDVTLNVISAYLEAVCQKELVGVARQQALLSAAQVDRMEKLLAEGKAAPADVAQIRTTLATDSLNLTQQENALMLSLLTLTQLLELDTPSGFDVETPNEDLPLDAVLPSPNAVMAEAQGFKPQVIGDQLRLLEAKEGIAVAKSALFPSLYFSAGIGTNYYRTSGYGVSSFGSQMRDNFNQYFGLSLSIPIFNRMQTRNNIRSARLAVHTQQLQLQETLKTLYREIQQAYYNAVAAQRQCQSAQVAGESAETSFHLMQSKYEHGKANVTEFQEAKTQLTRARSESVQARLTFLFRRRLLEFYRRPSTLAPSNGKG